MFMIKIILFESVSVLFCVFHISFRARSYGKIVRLFNLITGKKNSGLTPGAVVTHQTWMLFLASSVRENVWKKDRSSQVLIRINLPLLFTWSSLRILIDLKGFTCHWRFVTVNHFCCRISNSLPSLCLARYYNILIGKPVNVTKEKGRVANVSLGVVGLHVTLTKCPSLDITVIIIIITIIIFLATKFFLWRPFYN